MIESVSMREKLRSTGADTSATFGVVDGTSHSVELLLSVDRDGPHTLGAQIEEQLRTAIRTGALRPDARGAVDARPRAPARHLAAGRGRGVRAARGRGLPDDAPGRAPEGLRNRGPSSRRARAAADGPARALRLPPQRPRRQRVPPRRLAEVAAHRDRHAHRRRAAVRRPDRRRRAQAPTRGLPRAGARRRRRPGPRRGHQRLRPGREPAVRRPQGARREAHRRSRTRATPRAARSPPRAGLEPVPVPVDEHGPPGRRARRRRRGHRHARPPAPDRRRPRRRSAARSCCSGCATTTRSRSRTTTTPSTATTAPRSARSRGSSPSGSSTRDSAAKTLAPALRLGWLVVPQGLVEPIRHGKYLADLGTARIEQHAFADFIARGELDRHLRRMRAKLPGAARRARRGAGGGAAGGDDQGHRRRAARDRRAAARLRRDARSAAPRTEQRIDLRTLDDYEATGPPTLMLGYGAAAGARDRARRARARQARPSTSRRSRRVVDVSPDERFEALYREHYAAVLRFARRRTDPTTAEDVAAETFAIAWRRLDQGPGGQAAAVAVHDRRPTSSTTAAARPAATSTRPRRSPARPAATPPTRWPSATPSCAPSPASPTATAKPCASSRGRTSASPTRARVAGTTRVAFAVRVSRARKRLAAALEEPADDVVRAALPSPIVGADHVR